MTADQLNIAYVSVGFLGALLAIVMGVVAVVSEKRK